MTVKSLLAAGLTVVALALPSGVFAQDAAAPGAATDTVISPSGKAGTPAAATPEQNWLKICDPLEDGKRACIMRQVVVTPNSQFLGSFLLRDDPGQESRLLAVAAVAAACAAPAGDPPVAAASAAAEPPTSRTRPGSSRSTRAANAASVSTTTDQPSSASTPEAGTGTAELIASDARARAPAASTRTSSASGAPSARRTVTAVGR